MRLFREKTKAKVIAGFGLALSVVAVAAFLFYTSFTQLLSSVEVLSQPNNKLAKLQHILADIATAESSIRAYTLTSEEEYFNNYLASLDAIDIQIDTVRCMVGNSSADVGHIDSIYSLLQTKKYSIERYLELKKQRSNLDYSDKALRQIASSAKKQPTTTIIKQQTTTTISGIEPPAMVEKEPEEKPQNRRGLFSRIFSKRSEAEEKQEKPAPVAAVPVSVKQETSTDTSAIIAAPQPVAEVADVKLILRNINNEAERHDEILMEKELALLKQDQRIMDQIRAMIYGLEQSEKEQAELNSAQARQVVNETSKVLLVVGMLGLIGIVSFILLILRDITRSNAYKAQLVKARKEAVRLARAKEAFVANMSHEIRTPLNVVLGFSEQLQHTPLEATQQEHLQAINSAGKHLLHIVNDVLDLSKIEAGKLQINSEPFSLPSLITELEQAFALKAQSKGIRFKCEVDARLTKPLLGDPMRLKQVLFNLVDNAIKFTNEGQVTFTCKLKTQRRKQRVVALEVTDTGIGIPMEQAEHIFGEFNQADDTIIRKYGGTGLGLAISKQLVEMQHGKLTLSSTPGQGTTFSIVLPLKEAQQKEIPEEVSATVLSATTAALKHKRVLVIEDDAYSRSLCEIVLKRWGAEVYLASSGPEALAIEESISVDAVLTDVQLPGMSGKAVARAIRKRNATVPILALTANILSNDSRFFANTGISGFLLKPFSEQELYQKLVSALGMNTTIAEETTPTIATETTAEEPRYSLEEIRSFSGASNEALAAILEVLVQNNRQNLELLSAAAEAEDWQQVGALAHKMQTAFKHLQASTITPALSRLEQLLHQPQPETATLQAIVTQLQQHAIPVLRALEAEATALQTEEPLEV
ncbi:ATP-binding protein [Pontibacter harenae]|uniref:ATP-binding protein n=1 Tax=Pontibacter harenae TaxID=2894083 RepID=UPI001E3E3E6E|nr:ATP-binding protein [Pontibacter harenae]MCC9167861.1 response regulator [Pontibacter harenae]